MHLSLEDLQYVIEQNDALAPELLNSVFEGEEQRLVFEKGVKLSLQDIRHLASYEFTEVEVRFSRELLQNLHLYNPQRFPHPVKVMTSEDLVQELKYLDFVNKYSRHRRSLHSCMEVYDEEDNVLLGFNTRLTLEKWHEIEDQWPEKTPFAGRTSDSAILCLLNNNPMGSGSRRRFDLNFRLVKTLFEDLDKVPELNNLSKIKPESDIHIVCEPDQLKKKYKKENIRLIIVGEGFDDVFREALVDIKRYDPYARFMLAKRFPDAERLKFLWAVELNYGRDNWR